MKEKMSSLGRREFLTSAIAGGLVSLRAAETKGRFIDSARQFLDTLIDKGTDRYGKRHTPLFCLSLDPETHAPPIPPEKIDMQYARSFEYLYRDFGYYWKSHLHSAGPIYDQGTIRALYATSDATGSPKYRRAADMFLEFFLTNMVSEQTGMFGWGEHVFYNVFLDHMIGGAFVVRGNRNFTFEHELERWTTIYDVTWEKSPEKTLNEIEAIFEYKIHDPETFINNRHSDYFAGRKTGDTLTFIKHSGLFAHAFAFLYAKTGDRKHLDWARKSAALFWGQRDPRTNLVRGCIQRKDEPVAPAEVAQLVLFLLRAYQWYPEQQFADYAIAYLDAYRKYFSLADSGKFREVVATDGTDIKPGQVAEYWEGPIRMAKAAVLAYSMTGHRPALELAALVVNNLTPEVTFKSVIIRSLISDEIESRNCGLSTALDLYEVTGNAQYLKKAQSLAEDAIKKFQYRGLYVSSMQLYPEGDKTVRTKVYDGRSGAGWLALNLIRLQRDTNATDSGTFRKLEKLERIYD
jgi:uncharacterized protein YyaL (SSP411 family)